MITKEKREFNVLKVTLWVALLVLATIILKTLSFIFVPFCIALLFCYALGIPLEYMKRFRLPGPIRIFIVILFVVVCFYSLSNMLKANVSQFQELLPEFEMQFQRYADLLLDRLKLNRNQIDAMVLSFQQGVGQEHLKPVGTFVRYLGDALFSFLGNMLWVVLFMAFILAEKESLAKRLQKAVGEENAKPTLNTANHINNAVQHYLGLKTLISFLTGVLVFLVTWFFDVHFALLWGGIAFLFNFIPNIGSLIATIPPVAITLFQSGSLSTAGVVALCIIIIQLLVGNIVEPKMMGRGLSLSPLVVLLSLIFWGWMWGITGMLLSVPLTAAIKIALEQVESTRAAAVLISDS